MEKESGIINKDSPALDCNVWSELCSDLAATLIDNLPEQTAKMVFGVYMKCLIDGLKPEALAAFNLAHVVMEAQVMALKKEKGEMNG